MQYSKELQERLKQYFAQRYKTEITSEQADMYLDSFAELFLTIHKVKSKLTPTQRTIRVIHARIRSRIKPSALMPHAAAGAGA